MVFLLIGLTKMYNRQIRKVALVLSGLAGLVCSCTNETREGEFIPSIPVYVPLPTHQSTPTPSNEQNNVWVCYPDRTGGEWCYNGEGESFYYPRPCIDPRYAKE